MTIFDLNLIPMDTSRLFLLAADAFLVLHMLFVAFVVMGLMLIFVGQAYCWSWVRNPWFRVTHLLAVAVVVVQSWLGVICPLTRFEMALRLRAGDTVYSGSFISHWLERLLYYQAPWWVFVVGYTVFATVVVGSWFWVRPRRFTPLTRYRNDQRYPVCLSNTFAFFCRIAAWVNNALKQTFRHGDR